MTYDQLHEVAQYLYGLLDDIDTAGDIAKGDDKLFRKIVERTQSKKGVVVEGCDGYTVVLKPLPHNATVQRDFDDEYPWQDRSYETLNEYIGTTYHGRIKSRDGLQTIETSCPALTKFLLGALNADTYAAAHRSFGEADGCREGSE